MKNNLRSIRKQKLLTLKDLSVKTGLSIGLIGNFETGQRGISDDALQKISAALAVSVAEILPPDSQAPPGADAVICHDKLRLAPCPLCAEKSARIGELERERDFLRDQVSGLVSALAAKPTVCASAPPACGAAAGAGKNKERKDA